MCTVQLLILNRSDKGVDSFKQRMYINVLLLACWHFCSNSSCRAPCRGDGGHDVRIRIINGLKSMTGGSENNSDFWVKSHDVCLCVWINKPGKEQLHHEVVSGQIKTFTLNASTVKNRCSPTSHDLHVFPPMTTQSWVKETDGKLPWLDVQNVFSLSLSCGISEQMHYFNLHQRKPWSSRQVNLTPHIWKTLLIFSFSLNLRHILRGKEPNEWETTVFWRCPCFNKKNIREKKKKRPDYNPDL